MLAYMFVIISVNYDKNEIKLFQLNSNPQRPDTYLKDAQQITSVEL